MAKTLGLSLFFLTYGIFLINYYIDFNYLHRFVGLVEEKSTQTGEGHGLSLTAAEISRRIQPGEVIHSLFGALSNGMLLSARVGVSEYEPSGVRLSVQEIEQNNGRQYLRPGERIRSLADLKTKPTGIWIFTLNSPKKY